MDGNAVRLFFAIEHPLVRRGLITFCRDHEDMRVVGEAADGESALRAMSATAPDIVIVHADLPLRSGADVVRVLRKMEDAPRTIMLVPLSNRDTLRAAMAAPADAFLLTTDLPQHIVRTARMLMSGRQFTCPLLAACRDAILDGVVPDRVRAALNPEELQLFSHLTRNRNASQIARTLRIPPAVVAHLRIRMCEKLHAESGQSNDVINPRDMFIRGDDGESSRMAS